MNPFQEFVVEVYGPIVMLIAGGALGGGVLLSAVLIVIDNVPRIAYRVRMQRPKGG
jgi:hypothetical protein